MLLEIAAPPSAGKSTLLQVLRGLAADPAAGIRWRPADRAVLRPRWATSTPDILRSPERHPPSWGPLRRVLFRAPTDAELQEALGAVATSWDDFLRVVVGGPRIVGSSTVPALEVMAMRWLSESITTRALLELHAAARRSVGRTNGAVIDVLLLDDGLLHPYKLEAAVGRGDVTRREAYLATVPVPDVLVHLDAPVDLITRRLEHRHAARPNSLRARAINASHPDGEVPAFAAEAQRLVGLASVMAEALRLRGVPIIRVDAAATTAAQVDELIAGIRSLLAESLR